MTPTYDLLRQTLDIVETNLYKPLTASSLARELAVSAVHLQRVFKLAFEQSLASYIRERKLSVSAELLHTTDMRLIDISMQIGFDYEQSFIRTFKQAYELTPGEARQRGAILPLTLPKRLHASHSLESDGLFFGPKWVMVPQFYAVGRKQAIPFAQSLENAPKTAEDFWTTDATSVPNRRGSQVYIGMTQVPEPRGDFSYYTPSVPVHSLRDVPAGLTGYNWPAQLCARFHYVGQHPYHELNRNTAVQMYQAIDTYRQDTTTPYELCNHLTYFEKIDLRDCGDTYCKLQWYTPVKLRDSAVLQS